MLSDSIDDDRPTNNLKSEGTRRRRRGEYNYALHGATDHDRFAIGGNVNCNGRSDTQQSSRSKPKRTKAELDQFDVECEEQINGPAWITCYTICTRLAGGGLPALLLSRLVYWLQQRKLKTGPRTNPLAGWEHPVAAPGYMELARQVGVDTTNSEAARMKVKRALDNLVSKRRIKVAPGSPRRNLPEEVRAETQAPVDARASMRRRIWLSEETSKMLVEASILPRRQGSVKNIRVWLQDVRRFGANTAIVMGAMRWRFDGEGKKTLRVPRIGKKKWWVCSAAQMSQETGLSESQARRAMEFIVEQGQVIREIHHFKSSPTSFFRPDFDSRLIKRKKG